MLRAKYNDGLTLVELQVGGEPSKLVSATAFAEVASALAAGKLGGAESLEDLMRPKLPAVDLLNTPARMFLRFHVEPGDNGALRTTLRVGQWFPPRTVNIRRTWQQAGAAPLAIQVPHMMCVGVWQATNNVNNNAKFTLINSYIVFMNGAPTHLDDKVVQCVAWPLSNAAPDNLGAICWNNIDTTVLSVPDPAAVDAHFMSSPFNTHIPYDCGCDWCRWVLYGPRSAESTAFGACNDYMQVHDADTMAYRFSRGFRVKNILAPTNRV